MEFPHKGSPKFLGLGKPEQMMLGSPDLELLNGALNSKDLTGSAPRPAETVVPLPPGLAFFETATVTWRSETGWRDPGKRANGCK